MRINLIEWEVITRMLRNSAPPGNSPGDMQEEPREVPERLRVTSARSPTGRWAAHLGTALTTVASLGLLFALHQYWITDLRTALDQRELRATLRATNPADPGITTSENRAQDTSPGRIEESDALGVLQIPTLDLDLVVLNSATRSALQRGPGHLVGTSQPGDPGNAVIAGHRNTWGAPFANLDRLRPNDIVQWSDSRGSVRYRVVTPLPTAPPGGKRNNMPAPNNDPGYRLVQPSDISVTRQDATVDRLTFVTCHPRFSTAQRLVVVAERIDSPPRSERTASNYDPESASPDPIPPVAPLQLGLGEVTPPPWYDVALPGGTALLLWAWSGVLARSTQDRPRWRIVTRRIGWRLLGATLAAGPLLVAFDRLAGVLPAGQ
ncbi:MAG: sortase domain-containing protein [Actinomycetota bacterium]